jgi:DhnA family fructose-bisphosphate aldolase class Ia
VTAGRLILAADHRARGVITIEAYSEYLAALGAALPSCDGILATVKPLADLVDAGLVTPEHETYLSINRTGLAGSAFELDDRLVASVGRAVEEGWTGIKHMTRIDLGDPLTAPALELLGQVLEEARDAGIEALIEVLPWRDGRIDDRTDAIVLSAVITHDLGAPVLKLPLPRAAPGTERTDAVSRIVDSVGVPVLFLGGPWRSERDEGLAGVRDAMAGGAAGMAVGRLVFQDADPADMAQQVARIVHC